MERIVVGIDGSEHSARALAWAAAEAQLRGATLRVVHTWFELFTDGYFTAPAVYRRDVIEDAAREVLNEAVASVASGKGELTIDAALVHGQAATTLLEEAEKATLLVVGSRGRGGFKGLLVGSVSQQLISHAPCPVVVVR